MVVTEAFARGLPVITTDQAGASDLVRHGENGLIVPAGDPVALRDALHWCLDNRLRVYEMRFAALETAKRWQWTDYRRKFIEEVSAGLRRAGYRPAFTKMPLAPSVL
jgi:glycosyltransferase involved in cell wall biosynthesis